MGRRCAVLIIGILIISIIAIHFNNYIEVFIIPNFKEIKDYAESLLTISTVMMGFGFTVMGLLYTFDASNFVQKMQSTDYVIKRARCILLCLCVLGASSIASISLLLIRLREIYKYVYVFSVLSLLCGIILFIKSTCSVYRLICNVHEYDMIKIQKKYANYSKNRRTNALEVIKQEDDEDEW